MDIDTPGFVPDSPLLLGGGGVVTALLIYLLAWPTSVEPAAWQPPDPPAMEGPTAPNQQLREATRIAEGRLQGPEDVEVDEDGTIYAAVDGGRIVRIDPETEAVETFAETGGRPLGMQFDDSGNLVVGDAYEGLLSIDDSGDVEVLADGADGTPFGFTNDLDIADDGTIYFTDASHRFGQSRYLYDLLEARPHGRFLRYDPETDDVEVLLDDLYFANGVALAEDESFVVVNETYRYRIRRYWLGGDKKGTAETFADNLPGFPDNINPSPDGTFWLALYTVRNAQMDGLHPRPFAKKVVSRLPKPLWPAPAPYGFVAELNEEGEILRTLQDPGGDVVNNVTSVKQRDGTLYMGTLQHDWVSRLPLE